MTPDRQTELARWLLRSVGEAVLLATAAGVAAGLLTVMLPGLWTAAAGATTAAVTFGILLYRAGSPRASGAEESGYPASASSPRMPQTND